MTILRLIKHYSRDVNCEKPFQEIWTVMKTIFILMTKRTLLPNIDGSEQRKAFQDAAAGAVS